MLSRLNARRATALPWRTPVLAGLGLSLLAGVALAVDGLFVEPHRLRRNALTVGFRGLPAALDGLTILHLSDLHYVPRERWVRLQLEALEQATLGSPPDLIAITGDFVEWDEDAPAVAALVGRLRSRYGTFAVLGNHDYGNACDPRERATHPFVEKLSELIGWPLILWRGRPAKRSGNCIAGIVQPLEAHGVRVLRNEAVAVATPGGPLWIGGVDEPHQRRADPGAVFAAVPDGEPVLLLAHSPEVLERPTPALPGLTLVGHTHGGQVRLPGLKPLVTHTRLPLPAYRGLIQTPYGPMHLSAGMGASVPLRFRCPPEVTLLRLKAVPSSAAPPAAASRSWARGEAVPLGR